MTPESEKLLNELLGFGTSLDGLEWNEDAMALVGALLTEALRAAYARGVEDTVRRRDGPSIGVTDTTQP